MSKYKVHTVSQLEHAMSQGLEIDIRPDGKSRILPRKKRITSAQCPVVIKTAEQIIKENPSPAIHLYPKTNPKSGECNSKDSEIASIKLHHDEWMEGAMEANKIIGDLKARILQLEGAIECSNPIYHEGHTVSLDMAIDAGDRSLEGQPFGDDTWERCGQCKQCRVIQTSTTPPPSEEK